MVERLSSGLVALLIWPGLAGGALLSWLYLSIGRKLAARLQGRQGPPFCQPFFDFVKLLGKETVLPAGVNRTLFYALPAVALASVVSTLALIPAPGNPLPSWEGDLVLLLYLLEVPALCNVLAGYVSRSIYGQVAGHTRRCSRWRTTCPFWQPSWRWRSSLAASRWPRSQLPASGGSALAWLVRGAAAVAFLLALPARLKLNPFSIPNAEQEVLAGTRTEYNGAPLAFFELAHGLELVAMVELFGLFFLPIGPGPGRPGPLAAPGRPVGLAALYRAGRRARLPGNRPGHGHGQAEDQPGFSFLLALGHAGGGAEPHPEHGPAADDVKARTMI